MAAMPVGASTTMRLGHSAFSRRKKVVLPVPALPVRNKWVPVFSMNCHVKASSGFCFISKCCVKKGKGMNSGGYFSKHLLPIPHIHATALPGSYHGRTKVVPSSFHSRRYRSEQGANLVRL